VTTLGVQTGGRGAVGRQGLAGRTVTFPFGEPRHKERSVLTAVALGIEVGDERADGLHRRTELLGIDSAAGMGVQSSHVSETGIWSSVERSPGTTRETPPLTRRR
jgi:hypothetical protein